MANNQKKYISLNKLSTFLDNLKTLFATKGEVANKSDITHNHDSDYADINHNHDGVYATAGHNHDTKYDAKGAAAGVQENLNTVSDTLDAHTSDTVKHITSAERSNWNTGYIHSLNPHARVDATKVADSTTNGNILIDGTETTVYSHPTSGVTAGTYKSVTVNAQGHVTGGSNPTTLSGFGITDGALKSDVTNHNTSTSAHGDIRELITGLTTRLNTLANSDDTTLDQMSEIVAYIKSNKALIDGITTNKVNVADIINNLTTNVTNKPLSAAQGVEIKKLIDALDSALDTHDANTTKHITATERTNWNNAKTLAENALPTSGGTMTGAIEMGQSNLAKRSVDTSSVSIYGGTDSSNGASITAYGKEQAIYPGSFVLKANNGEESAVLEGKPDGTLRWKGKNVMALGTSDAIPISNGGTGATTASEALSNLGGMSKSNPTVTGSFSMNKLYSSSIGSCSFVEGYNCSAAGDYGAHGEGYYTEANGNKSHAEGDGSVANGIGSHAEGQETIATCDYQHVQGKYNIEDTNETYAHIVGNGTSNSKRSNAHTVDWNGNGWFAGDVYVGGISQSDTNASKVITEADHKWNLLYDSGEISDIVNSISNIDVSGYTNIQVLVRIYNDGDSVGSRNGSAIFKCANGKSYQFPVWANMFSKSINTVYTMATFNLVDGWLICPCASRLIGDASTFEDTEGGTAGSLSPVGSGMMKCTSSLSTLTISSLDQNSNYYFGMGSRVMVWGWNA